MLVTVVRECVLMEMGRVIVIRVMIIRFSDGW